MFESKDKLIREWNQKPGVTHMLGHNKFSDWTEAEVQRLRGSKRNEVKTEEQYFEVGTLPASIDWRQKGGVTPV